MLHKMRLRVTVVPGQAVMVAVIFLLFLGLAFLFSFSSIGLRETNSTRIDTRAKQSYFLAEAGMEDVMYRIMRNKQYGASESVSLDGISIPVTVTDSGSQKIVESIGNISQAIRKTSSTLSITTTGIGFYYGVQVGDGGLTMDNNSWVNGNVYSNGSITGGNGATIIGDAIVAGGITSAPSVSWSTENADQFFATVSGNRDIAQSFDASATGNLNRISVLIGKVGNPTTNITLRITADNSGKPATASLASVSIPYTNIGVTPSWIDVAFSSAPMLTSGVKYWIVLDYSLNSGTNHWKWRKDSSDGYASNTGRTASNWSSGSAVWTNIGGDLAFKAWIGGVNTKIDGMTIGSATSGSGQANIFVNTIIRGSSCPNVYCIITNPPRQELPIPDGVVQDWRDAAEAAGTCVEPQCDASGNFLVTNGASKSLGAKKITGNLIVDNNATLTVTGVIWVVGDITLSNGCIVRLSPAYGGLSGIILTDQTVDVSNVCTFQGSGSPGSYIMILSDKNTPTSTVIDVNNNSLGVIYYASKGIIDFANNAGAKEATAYGIHMQNNATITYESGLASAQFSTGPSGGWSIERWNEIK